MGCMFERYLFLLFNFIKCLLAVYSVIIKIISLFKACIMQTLLVYYINNAWVGYFLLNFKRFLIFKDETYQILQRLDVSQSAWRSAYKCLLQQ